MKTLSLSFKSLKLAMRPLSKEQAIITLRCLKEAAISDQEFEEACLLRDMERKLTGGKSGINTCLDCRDRMRHAGPLENQFGKLTVKEQVNLLAFARAEKRRAKQKPRVASNA